MEAKLKGLKVVELKEILSKASVSAPAKANKQDLIARILANKPALSVYDSLYPSAKAAPNDDLLAPPEDVDWNAEDAVHETTTVAGPTTKTVSKSTAKPPSASMLKKTAATSTAAAVNAAVTAASARKPQVTPSATQTPKAADPSNPTKPDEDEELAKRKARAARFGIPLVEPAQPRPKAKAALAPTPAQSTRQEKATVRNGGQTKALVDDPDKLAARAKRFGAVPGDATATSTPLAGKKRPAPAPAEVGEEELEKRRKRAERFGTATKA